MQFKDSSKDESNEEGDGMNWCFKYKYISCFKYKYNSNTIQIKICQGIIKFFFQSF